MWKFYSKMVVMKSINVNLVVDLHEFVVWQHDSNFPIHEGFGDFYQNLGDSRSLYKETQSKSKDASVDVNDKKHEKERDDYQKAMDEYAIVS